MTFLNRVILTGKVATPLRRHYRPDGSPVIQFTLELNDSENPRVPAQHRDSLGQAVKCVGSRQGRNRIDIVAFGKLAESKLDFLQRGQHLMVVGKLNQRRWQAPEGKDRIRTEVIATVFRTIDETNRAQKS